MSQTENIRQELLNTTFELDQVIKRLELLKERQAYLRGALDVVSQLTIKENEKNGEQDGIRH